MEKIRVIIISLLIIAIVFSVISMIMNSSFDDFKKIRISRQSYSPGETGGNLNLYIESNTESTGGGK